MRKIGLHLVIPEDRLQPVREWLRQNTVNDHFRKAITLGRPGLFVTIEWRRNAYVLKPFTKWGEGFAFLFPGKHLRISILWSLRRLILPTVKCSDCGRRYSAEQVSPMPGDPAWATITPEARGRFSGMWYQGSEFDQETQKYVELPYRWIGPCCELRDSGYPPDDEDFDDDLDDLGDDLDYLMSGDLDEVEDDPEDEEDGESDGDYNAVDEDSSHLFRDEDPEESETAWDDAAEETAEEIDRIFREEHPEEYREAEEARKRAGLE